MKTLILIVVEFWAVLGAMAPYLLFGFFMAGVLAMFLSAETVERQLGGGGGWPVLKAAFWGVPLPLCSCSVIPVATSLRKHGASRGATTAFLLSTPQTGVDSIFVTYSLLGPVFAVFRPIAAFVTGLLGGTLVAIFDREHLKNDAPARTLCEDECCSPTSKSIRWLRGLRHGFVTLPRDIGRELLIGLGIAGLITALIPPDLFSGALKPGPLQMAVMMALGIPIYVCATASVPIAAALIAKGVSPGAAFAFLVTGPATNAATLMTLLKLLGWKSAAIYLATIVVGALGGGWMLDQLTVTQGAVHAHAGHFAMPGVLQSAAAVALLGILGFAVFGHRKAKKNEAEDEEADEKGTALHNA